MVNKVKSCLNLLFYAWICQIEESAKIKEIAKII